MVRPNLKGINKNVVEYIESLESQLKSPFYDSYMAIKKIVDRGNLQLTTTEIDIFDPEHEKKSVMIGKFLDKLENYSKQMEYFKSKMNPEELKKASQVVKAEGVEEYLKENGKI